MFAKAIGAAWRPARSILRFLASGVFQERLWGLALLVGLLALRVWDPSPLQILRVKGFDTYQYLEPRQVSNYPVVIVDIDEKSLNALGQWPWPRTLLADLVERLQQQGVAAIGFDMVFPEADRMSPTAYGELMRSLPEGVRETLRELPSNDARFAQAMAGGRVVLGAALRPDAPEAETIRPAPAQFALLGGSPLPYLFGGDRLVRNLPELEAGAQGIGLITNYPEFDGVVRRIPAVYRIGDELYPALGVELLRVATGQSTLVVRTGPNGIEGVVLANVFVPTDSAGRVWVRYSGHDPNRYVSASDVLAGRVPTERLQGRLVLIGSSATGLLDIKATPISRAIPGVEIHAQFIENVLQRSGIQRPGWALPAEALVTLIVGLALVWFVPRLGAFWALMVGMATMLPLLAGAWLYFSRQGLLLDATFPVGATLSVYAVLAFFNYVREERSRRRIRDAFGHYLAPSLVGELEREPDKLVLGGEIRTLTVLFSDIRSFSTISERLSAQELTRLINDYMTPMAGVVLDHKGTIDKFIGDAIMAFWNAPIDDPEHARNACKAALAMQAALVQFNEARRKNDPDSEPFDIGVGINTGPCCVGNLGSAQRFDYSALGDSVNIASRLEAETKIWGVRVIVGESTQALVPEFAMIELGQVVVRGRVGAVTIYALLGDDRYAKTPEFERLAELNAAMREAVESGDADRVRRLKDDFVKAGGPELSRLADRYLDLAAKSAAEEPVSTS